MNILTTIIKIIIMIKKYFYKSLKLLLFSLGNSKINLNIIIPFARYILPIRNTYKDYHHKYKTIYIHIPKCAGQSIERALFNEKVGHNALWHYQLYNTDLLNKYFKFTFVRNPWDRLVSGYFFLKKGGRNPVDKSWSQRMLSNVNSFEEFIYSLGKDKKYRKKVLAKGHFIPQYKFITDFRGKIGVDFLGHVENINQDFNFIKNKLGIYTAELGHNNRSNHNNYKDYYNSEMIEIVRKIYKKDIELLNYIFDE